VGIVAGLATFFQGGVNGVSLAHVVVALGTSAGYLIAHEAGPQTTVGIVARAALLEFLSVTLLEDFGVAGPAQAGRCGTQQPRGRAVGVVAPFTERIPNDRRVNLALFCRPLLMTFLAKVRQAGE
jgi:hypothetical protein